jgi:hypothetical protein
MQDLWQAWSYFSICPDSKPPVQIHAMPAADDASVASDKENVIILTQVHTRPV